MHSAESVVDSAVANLTLQAAQSLPSAAKMPSSDLLMVKRAQGRPGVIVVTIKLPWSRSLALLVPALSGAVPTVNQRPHHTVPSYLVISFASLIKICCFAALFVAGHCLRSRGVFTGAHRSTPLVLDPPEGTLDALLSWSARYPCVLTWDTTRF